jgi:hypothetical protein
MDKICVWDYGMFFNVAQELSKTAEVYYYMPRNSNFPTLNTERIGYGYPNIKCCSEDDIWKNLDDFSLICFPDTGDGGLQKKLRETGYNVYGSALAEKMELDRVWFKQELKKLGLPVNYYKTFTDVDKLREYLEKNDDLFIKFPYFRGIAESKSHSNWKDTEEWWAKLNHDLGPLRHHFEEFIVESPIKAKVECGTDRYYTPKGYYEYFLTGIEIKNECYIAKVVTEKEAPKLLMDTDNKVATLLNKYDCRSSVSTELRIPKKDLGYLIDYTARSGCPPMSSVLTAFGNTKEIMMNIAENKIIDQDIDYKYVVEIELCSDAVIKDWLPVSYPKEFEDNIKLKSPCIIDGQHFVIPIDNGNGVGQVVVGSDNLDDAIEECLDICEEIETEGLSYHKESFEKAKEQLKEAIKMGVGFA